MLLVLEGLERGDSESEQIALYSLDTIHQTVNRVSGRPRQTDLTDDLAIRIMKLLVWSLAQRAAAISAVTSSQQQQQQQNEWMKETLLRALSIAARLHNGSTASKNTWARLALEIARVIQHLPTKYADSARCVYMLRWWLDVMLLEPVSRIGGTIRLRNVVAQMRRNLQNHPISGELHQNDAISYLCCMVVEGILAHDPDAHHIVAEILDKIANYRSSSSNGITVSLSSPLVNLLFYKCYSMPPSEKWKWFLLAHESNNVELRPQAMAQILVECDLADDRATSQAVVQFVQDNNVPITEDIALQMIRSKVHRETSTFDAMELWMALKERAGPSVQWNGTVLLIVLSLAVSHQQHELWILLVRTILQQSAEEHGGAWPNPFFNTVAQKNSFIRTSDNIISTLLRWSENNADEQDFKNLAAQWDTFAQRQLELHGDNVTEAKIVSWLRRQGQQRGPRGEPA